MKVIDNTYRLETIQPILSYFLVSQITSYKFYGYDSGVLYSIENKIFENIETKLRGESNREGFYPKECILSALEDEIKLLSIYRYSDIGDACIDDDYNGVDILYEVDYHNREYADGSYDKSVARCDVFILSDMKHDIYNKPSRVAFNKNIPYGYLFGSMDYLVEKMLHSGARTIEFHPISAIEGGGFNTDIKILNENKETIETIKSNGSSVYSMVEVIDYEINNEDGVEIIEDDMGKRYSFPQASFSEDGLHFFLTEESVENYRKWNEQSELSYREDIESPTQDMFYIEIEMEDLK